MKVQRLNVGGLVIALVTITLLTGCFGGVASAECEEVEPWLAATADRNERFAEEFEVVAAKFDDGCITQEDFRAAIQKMDEATTAHARSNPPPAAAPMNALFVDALERYTDLMVTASNGGNADTRAADSVLQRAKEADAALREQCGL